MPNNKIDVVTILNQGGSLPAPSASDWTAYWQAFDGTSCFSDAGSTLCNNNDDCHQWSEEFGNVASAEFLQATSTNQPTFKTGGDSGKSYLEFDIDNDYMDSLAISNFFAAGAKTMVYALKVRTGWVNGDIIAGDASAYFVVSAKTGPKITFQNYDTNYDETAGQSFTADTSLIYSCKHDTGNIYDAKNNATWGSAVASGNTGSLAGALRMGRTTGVAMDLYAVLVANSVVADATVLAAVNYFKSQMGI